MDENLIRNEEALQQVVGGEGKILTDGARSLEKLLHYIKIGDESSAMKYYRAAKIIMSKDQNQRARQAFLTKFHHEIDD